MLPRLHRLTCWVFCSVLLANALLQAEVWETPLDDFEKVALAWNYVGGEEFPGARGSFTRVTTEAHNGTAAGQLQADFRSGGAYVGIWKNLPAEKEGDLSAGTEVEDLRFWVKGDHVSQITIRLNDATGQCHQKGGIRLAPGGAWQEIVVKRQDIVGGEHWGGANDGRWHGPAKGLGINVSLPATGDGKQGTLWIDDFRLGTTSMAELPGLQKPSLLGAVLSQPSARPGYGLMVNYRWDAQPMARDYKVFVHVLGSDGKLAFQADHELPAPTTHWSGRVDYQFTLAVPPETPAGQYSIVMGLWDSTTGKRPALDAGPGAAALGGSEFRVATFQVTPDAPLPSLGKPTLDLTGYRLTFDENFDQPLDVSAWGPGTRWIAHTPFAGDFGDARFADPAKDFPFTIEKGILRIEAQKRNGHWESGLLASVDREGHGFAQRFGYFEMRAKLPKGEGVWPAFWLMGLPGLKDKSITNIEFDVLEQYGARPNILCATTHFWGPGKAHRSDGREFIVPGMTDDFHRYGVMIENDFTTYYFDGIPLRRFKTPEEGKVPVYLLVNLALGSGWPIEHTPDPSILQVDWVRAYARQP